MSYALTVGVSDGKGGSDSIAVTVSLTDVWETPPEEETPPEPAAVTACFTNLNELTAAVEYAAEWDDADCRAHHRDSLVRYFHFTLPEETTVGISLESAEEAQLFVSKGTSQNGWGAPPNGAYEDRRMIRHGNGKLAHDGAHTELNSVTLTLVAGDYTAEATGPVIAGAFTITIGPQ